MPELVYRRSVNR